MTFGLWHERDSGKVGGTEHFMGVSDPTLCLKRRYPFQDFRNVYVSCSLLCQLI